MGVVYETASEVVLSATEEQLKEIQQSIQGVSAIDRESGLVCVPRDWSALRVLFNIGVDTTLASPLAIDTSRPLVGGQFDLKRHQIIQSEFFLKMQRGFCTSTMRTGKTASAIYAACYAQRNLGAGAALIVSTVSTMTGVWKSEIEGMYPNATVQVLHGGVATRRALLEKPADFYIINYAGVKVLKDELTCMISAGLIDICIIDELTHYANASSQQWRAMNFVINNPVKPCRYVWGMTGTPGDPIKVYGQVRLVKPQNMPYSLTAWKALTMQQYGPFRMIPRDGHIAHIKKAMHPCIRYDKADVLDLPPVTYRDYQVDLTPAQEHVVRALRREMQALVAGGGVITPATQSVAVMKVLQVCSGVVRDDEGNSTPIDCHPRFDALEDILKTTARKCVIFASYTGVIDNIVKEMRARGYTIDKVDGSVSLKKRTAIFDDFQNNPDGNRLIVCHPQTTAFGVELAAADTMVFFGPPMSGDFVYQQAVERLSSLKQESASCQILHLVGSNEEKTLLKGIRNGVSINTTINEIFTSKNL